MAINFTLPQEFKILSAMAPAADAAGRTARYVTLKEAFKAYIVCHINQGNAATILLTPLQAQDVSGTGSKVLTQNARIWACLDTVTTDALVLTTSALNYTTDAGVKEKVVVFEIDPASLDQVNGFKTVAFSTGASNAANITAGVYYLGPQRHTGDTLITATAN